jgi:hypothetical protein
LKYVAVGIAGILALIGPLLLGGAALFKMIMGFQMAMTALRLAGFLAQGEGILVLLPKIAMAIRGIAMSSAAALAPVAEALAIWVSMLFIIRAVNAAIRMFKAQQEAKENETRVNNQTVETLNKKYPNSQAGAIFENSLKPFGYNKSMSDRPAPLAITINIPNAMVAVPEGTTGQQMAALRAGAETILSDSLMSQIKKHIVSNIQKSQRDH